MKAKNINALALFEISFLRMKKITLKEKNLPHFSGFVSFVNFLGWLREI